MKFLFAILLCALLLPSCSRGQRGVDELTAEESGELNHYLSKHNECLVQESARLDDNTSDINALVDLVMWKCQPVRRQTDSLLYDKFKVALSSSYAFKMQMEEGSKKKVTEAILTNRKMRAGLNPAAALLQQAPVILPPVRMQQQQQAPRMVPEGVAPIPTQRPVQQRVAPPYNTAPQAPPAPAPGQPVSPAQAVQGW